MLNDSGPIFPAPGQGNQFLLHEEIKQIWNTNFRVDQLTALSGLDLSRDFGLVIEANARLYPDDRLGTALFRRDAIYSGYSYARFFDLNESTEEGRAEVLRLWNEDIDNMIAQHDRYSNLYYHIPYFRNLNSSHCTTIVNWNGTQILQSEYEIDEFIIDLLSGTEEPLSSDEGFNENDDFVDFLHLAVDQLL